MFKDSTLMFSILRGLFSADKIQTLFRRKISLRPQSFRKTAAGTAPDKSLFPNRKEGGGVSKEPSFQPPEIPGHPSLSAGAELFSKKEIFGSGTLEERRKRGRIETDRLCLRLDS